MRWRGKKELPEGLKKMIEHSDSGARLWSILTDKYRYEMDKRTNELKIYKNREKPRGAIFGLGVSTV